MRVAKACFAGSASDEFRGRLAALCNTDHLNHEADRLWWLGDPQALEILREAIQCNPMDDSARLRAAFISVSDYLELRELNEDEALGAVRSAESLFKNEADRACLKGLKQLVDARPSDAAKEFRRAAAQRPQDYRILYWLGRTQSMTADSHADNDRACQSLQHYAEALKTLDSSKSLLRDSAHFGAGEPATLSKTRAALLHNSTKIASDRARCGCALVRLTAARKLAAEPARRQEALRIADSVLGGATDLCLDQRILALDIKGYVLFEKGSYNEAKQNFEKALRLDPSNGSIQVSLAAAMVELGEFDKTRERMRNLLSVSGRQDWTDKAYCIYAKAEVQLGDTAKACKLLGRIHTPLLEADSISDACGCAVAGTD